MLPYPSKPELALQGEQAHLNPSEGPAGPQADKGAKIRAGAHHPLHNIALLQILCELVKKDGLLAAYYLVVGLLCLQVIKDGCELRWTID
jgi:hypothetical protein